MRIIYKEIFLRNKVSKAMKILNCSLYYKSYIYISHHLKYTCTLIIFPVIIGITIFKSIIVNNTVFKKAKSQNLKVLISKKCK